MSSSRQPVSTYRAGDARRVPRTPARSGSPAGSRPRPAAGRRPAGRPARRRAPRRRRPLLWLALVLVLVGGVVVAFAPPFRTAVNELGLLPLRHEDIIRQQAREKGLDPALVAGVIYTESHFRDDQESPAGALGLMQITPATASDVARQSGGTAFTTGDLHTPQVNISYGTYRLRYLLQQFDGNTREALAAYNAGEGNVRRWIARANAAGTRFTTADIPFAETRAYVGKVLDARRDYARTYPKQLGLR